MADGPASPSPGGTSKPGSIRTATPGPVSVPSSAQASQTGAKDFVGIAIERGYCTAAQVAEVRMDMQEAGKSSPEELAAMLVQKGVLTQQQARACERAVRGATVIAGFEILEKVGQGGMGAVFRAKQISMERIVALKILPPKLAQDPGFKQRFLHEARLSAKLSHLNIISGIDCGEAGGYTFFAMEFVDGKTVKQILKERGKLPAAEAYAIVRQMAEALVYAEAHSLVHRDIKPDNIMLTQAGIAKLCDLGLAKQTEKADDASMTQAGQAVGTPHFISPEQARGERSVDTRSDIYSLGASFYTMLSGKTPFEAATGAAVMALHITDDVKNPCDDDPSIPVAYGEILSKMMAKSVAERYASAKELLDDLNAANEKRATKASTFKAKSSCTMPKRSVKTGLQIPVSDSPLPRVGTNRHEPVGKPKLIAAAATGLLLLGGVAYVAFGTGDKNNEVAVAPPDKKQKVEEKKEATSEKKVDPPSEVKPPDPTITEKKELPPVEPPVTEKKETIPVKPPVETVTKPPDVVKPPEPPVKTVTKPPVEPPKNLVSSVAVPDEVNLPVPVLKPTPEMLYARFLGELTKLTAKGDLQKLQNDVRELSLKTEYSTARTFINTELSDFAAAATYEIDSMKKRASAGGFLDLNEETARKFEASKGKIMSFDPAKGFSVEVNSRGNKVWLFVAATAISIQEIMQNSPDRSALASIRYLCARGNHAEAAALLPQLHDDKARWERKTKLMASGEIELQAEAYFQNMAKIAEAKSWRTYKTMADEFDKLYAKTSAGAEHLIQVVEWRKLAAKALQTDEGLESTGKFVPVKWPNVNACEVTEVVDPDTSNKSIVLKGEAGAGLPGNGDKSAISRVDLTPLDLSDKKEIVFRAMHEGEAPLQVCMGFLGDNGYHESLPVTIKPGDWYENTISIEGSVFKSAATGYDKYDQPLPDRSSVKMLLILVYTKHAYELKIDKIVVK